MIAARSKEEADAWEPRTDYSPAEKSAHFDRLHSAAMGYFNQLASKGVVFGGNMRSFLFQLAVSLLGRANGKDQPLSPLHDALATVNAYRPGTASRVGLVSRPNLLPRSRRAAAAWQPRSRFRYQDGEKATAFDRIHELALAYLELIRDPARLDDAEPKARVAEAVLSLIGHGPNPTADALATVYSFR